MKWTLDEVKAMSLQEKLSHIRVDLGKEEIKKKGRNDYAKFNYFNLQDFLPKINELFEAYRISYNSGFEQKRAIVTKNGDLESVSFENWYSLALINIDNAEDVVVSTMPTGDALTKGSTEMQNIGSMETYCRKYRIMAILGISESDKLDEQTAKPCEKQQLEKINELYTEEEIKKMLRRLKMKGLEEMTWYQAEKCIEARTTGLYEQKETF